MQEVAGGDARQVGDGAVIEVDSGGVLLSVCARDGADGAAVFSRGGGMGAALLVFIEQRQQGGWVVEAVQFPVDAIRRVGGGDGSGIVGDAVQRPRQPCAAERLRPGAQVLAERIRRTLPERAVDEEQSAS